MSTDRFYPYRKWIVGLSFIFIAYVSVYLLLFTPYEEFWTGWDPDHQLVVLDTTDTSAEGLLLPQDIITAVDGQPINRVSYVYPFRQSESHTLTILRSGERFTVTVPYPNSLSWKIMTSRVPAILVGFSGWLIGALCLFASHSRESHKSGYLFIAAGVLIVALQGDITGVPGTIFVAHPFLFFLPAIWAELGFTPRQNEDAFVGRKLIWVLISMGVLFGLLGLIDIWLMLYQTSFDAITGVSLDAVAIITTSGSFLIAVTILIYRLKQNPNRHERTIVKLVLFSIVLGIAPLVFMSIVPAVFFNVEFLPFPVAILLVILIPAGYFMVINRKGYLQLDKVYVRLAAFVLMALGLFSVGTGLLYMVQQWTAIPAQTAAIVFPILLLSAVSNQLITRLVKNFVYGRNYFAEADVNELALLLSRWPEWSTLQKVVQEITARLYVEKGLLLVSSNGKNHVTSVGVSEGSELPQFIHPLNRPVLHLKDKTDLFRGVEWGEIILPVSIGPEQIGTLWLSSPISGQFTSIEVEFLQQITAVIAMAVQSIHVLTASQRVSAELVAVQERERKRLASEIHDHPLQIISHVLTRLEGHSTSVGEDVIGQVAGQLRNAASDLRRICQGLYPPVIDWGLHIMVEDVLEKARSLGSQLIIRTDIQLCEPPTLLPPDVAASIYYVLLEAINNVIKHANASYVTISVLESQSSIFLSISDDGLGIQTPISLVDLVNGYHLGLLGMFSRAERVGGTIQIRPNANGRGTTVVFNCPKKSTQ